MFEALRAARQPGLCELPHGHFSAARLPSLLALAGPAIVIAPVAVAFFRRGGTMVRAAALAWFAWVPFIIWWEPFEPKWLIPANVFLLKSACAATSIEAR